MHSSNSQSIYSNESMSKKVQHLNSKLNCLIIKDKSVTYAL